MGVPATVLFVDDNGTGLPLQPKLYLGPSNGIQQILFRGKRRFRRVQTQREQKLCALCGLGDRIGLRKCPIQIVRNEAPDIKNLNMIISAVVEQMCRQLPPTATLRMRKCE